MTAPSKLRQPRLSIAIVALGITQIIGWGTTFYLPAIVAQTIADDLGLSSTHYLLAFSWCLLIAGLLSRRLGQLIDRIGAAPVLTTGSLVTALALTLHATVDGPAGIWVAWSVIGLTLRAVLYDGAFAALTALSPGQSRRSISLLTLMGGLASTAFWPLSGWLLELTDWRSTLLIYAALNALVCAPLHWWCAGRVPSSARSDPSSRAPLTAASRAIEPTIVQAPDEQAIRFREQAIRLFGAALALHALVSYALSTHLPAMLGGLGLTPGGAILVAALMGPAQVLARIIELRLQKSMPALSLTVPIFALMPLAFAGFMLLPLAPTGGATVAAALVVLAWGACNGLMTIIRGSLPVALFGPKGYGEVLGRLAAPTLYLGAIAPALFGLIIEQLGEVRATALLWVIGVFATWMAARLVRLAKTQSSSSIQAC
jgi:MFS family permease